MEGAAIGNNNDKKKPNTVVSFNVGGGIGGIVVLGGVMAFAALVTLVANKKNKTKPTKKDQSVDSDSCPISSLKNKKRNRVDGGDETGSEGLKLLVQSESDDPVVNLNPSVEDNEKADFDFDEVKTTQNSILEEIRLSEINGGKEPKTQQNGDRDNLFQSDLINPIHIVSPCIDTGEKNENQKLQVVETSSSVPEEAIEVEAEQMLLDLIEKEKQEKINADIASIEENKECTEEVEDNDDNDNDNDDDEYEEEESKGSSEETRDSSIESNAEPIWPTETLDNLSMELKGNNFTNQESVVEKIGKTDNSNEYDELITRTHGERFKIVQETVNSRRRRGVGARMMMMMLILGIALLLMIASWISYYPHLF